MIIILSTELPLGEIWNDSSFVFKILIYRFFLFFLFKEFNPIPYGGSCQEKGLPQPSDIRVDALLYRADLSSLF